MIYNIPIDFDLEKLRSEHQCVNYFETGLWNPRDNVSSKQALACSFDKVSCIEIRRDWVRLGNEIFKEQIKKRILTINKDYKFATLNGYIKDDVLLAYI